MPPPKRRTKGAQAVHQGRVTRPKIELPIPTPSEFPFPPRSTPAGRPSPGPPPSSRYTPRLAPSFRLRPEWHKFIGIASIVVGLGLFIVCRLNTWGIHGFGGHVWYLVGLSLAASGTWWFGWFDRQK